MEKIKFDLNKKGIPFKILNATNGGPWYLRHTVPWINNYEAYKAARIPYQRNHDSALSTIYGGPYCYDISAIFTNFDADVNDPSSYDFACTDEAIAISMEAGTEVFYRLGEFIKYHIKPRHIKPNNFKKWAEICEHIIMHYNEGWADGFHYNIKYWEIWAEPDLSYPDDRPVKPTWGGTREEFFDFYEIVAKHLKGRFPQLQIGGPSLMPNGAWTDAFLSEMSKRKVPLDFLSWHKYHTEPEIVLETAQSMKGYMTKHGYNIPSLCNEWNYMDWSKRQESLKALLTEKGAAYMMACISLAQQCPDIDMLMYYDTRPSCWCGAFDTITGDPLKGYYPLYWYGMFYDLECDVQCVESPDKIYTLCGVGKD